METINNFLVVATIDMDAVERGAAAGSVTPADLAVYRTLADDVAAGRLVLVSRMAGTFGPLGQMAFDLALIAMDGQAAVQGDLSDTSSGAGRRPADAWTAIRLLTEGKDVTLTFRRQGAATARPTAHGAEGPLPRRQWCAGSDLPSGRVDPIAVQPVDP